MRLSEQCVTHLSLRRLVAVHGRKARVSQDRLTRLVLTPELQRQLQTQFIVAVQLADLRRDRQIHQLLHI